MRDTRSPKQSQPTALVRAASQSLGKVSNLTVTRYTPRDVPGLSNKDSGDAAGDLYFGLEELVTPMHCRLDPSYFKCRNGTGRFLYYDDVYASAAGCRAEAQCPAIPSTALPG